MLTDGPLQALAMAEHACGKGFSSPAVFDHSLVAPMFNQQGMVVSATGNADIMDAAVRDNHGRQTTPGTLRRIKS